MVPIYTPCVAAFLQHLYDNHGYIRTINDIDEKILDKLIDNFESLIYSKIKDLESELDGSLPIKKRDRQIHVTKDKLQRTLRYPDKIRRYHEIPTKGIFFYTSEEHELANYIKRNWSALHEKTGSKLDIFDYQIRTGTSTYQSWTRLYMKALSNIPGISDAETNDAGLPFLLLWTPGGEHVIVPFSDVYMDDKKIRGRMRQVLECVSLKSLDIESIDYLNNLGYGPANITNHLSPIEPEPCDVFISYSHNNKDQIIQLSERLMDAGIQPWFDNLIRCGERWANRIYQQIYASTVVIICWSATSIKSPWVLREAKTALDLGKRIFPIALDDNLAYPAFLEGRHTLSISLDQESAINKLLHEVRSSMSMGK